MTERRDGPVFPADYPTQGQLFHRFELASAKGHSATGPRELAVQCICGWRFEKRTGIKRSLYKKQLQDLYQQHVRAELDNQNLFATWASGIVG
jgi:hypothetical protein